MCRLLFSPHLCKDTGHVRVGRCALASDEGMLRLAFSRNYGGLRLLRRFKREVCGDEGFTWSEHRWKDRRCRTAVISLPTGIAAFRDALESSELTGDDLVYFVSGRKGNDRERRRLQKERQEEALAMPRAYCTDAAMIVEYLNQRPSNSYKAILKHEEEARAYIATLPGQKMVTQRRVLEAILACPQQLYGPSSAERTVRVFGLGEGLTCASKGLRRILCQDWVEVDLCNAQLAIVARLWNMPDITAFLREHGSIWPRLLSRLGVGEGALRYDEIKGVCKRALYAIIFGMRAHGVKRLLREELGALGVDDPLRLLDDPIMSQLLERRKLQIEQLLEAGGAFTIYDQWLPAKNRAQVRSVLAQQAQAVELKLIVPIYELAKDTRDFRVMLHQHDGVSIHFQRRREMWQRRINEAVDQRAKELGIETRLEWQDTPSQAPLVPSVA